MDEYTFDIEQWLPRFPLQTEWTGVMISRHGPAWICEREQLWRQAAMQGGLGRTVPTDVFALAFGEPERRDVTKIGGVPYRPAGLKWPRSEKTGHDYGMVAQFRFTESKDIVRDLPDDILLCFFENSSLWKYDGFDEPPVFEWYPLGLTDLMAPEDLPTASFELPPACYGRRYRTVDYADQIAVDRVKEVLPEYLYDVFDCDESDRDVRCLSEWPGFKIGGIPRWKWPEEIIAENVEQGTFLASIPSIWGDREGLYPWVNQETEVFHEHFLFGIGGIVHLFLDADGNVQPRFDS